MSPEDPLRALPPSLLPSITERSVAGREDLKVAVCILPHDGFGKIAVLLWWFGTIKAILGPAKGFPAAPSSIRRYLPDVPKSVISAYHEELLAKIFIPSHSHAVRSSNSWRRLAQFCPTAPVSIRRRLKDLPDVSITAYREYFLPAILISPDSKPLGQQGVFCWGTQGLPSAPAIIRRYLPFLSELIVITYTEDFQAAVSIFPDDVRFNADV